MSETYPSDLKHGQDLPSAPTMENPLDIPRSVNNKITLVLFILATLINIIFAFLPLSVSASIPTNLVPLALIGIFVSLGVSIILSFCFLKFLQKHTRGTIVFLFVSTIIFFSIATVVAIFINPILAIFFGLGALFTGYLYYRAQKRIDFTVQIVKMAITAAMKNPSIFRFLFAYVLFCGVWLVVWGLALVKALSFGGGAMALSIFCGLWTSKTLIDVLYTTISGVICVWYSQNGNIENSNPTIGMFKTILKYHVGSVALGSLLVTIFTFIRSQSRADGWPGLIFRCILSCIEGLIEFVNKHAFPFIALEGHTFFEACKLSFRFIGNSGIQSIIDSTIIDMFSFIVKFLTGGIAGAIVYLILVSKGTGIAFFGLFLGFIVGYFTVACTFFAVNSIITTLLICWSKNPQFFNSFDSNLSSKFENGAS